MQILDWNGIQFVFVKAIERVLVYNIGMSHKSHVSKSSDKKPEAASVAPATAAPTAGSTTATTKKKTRWGDQVSGGGGSSKRPDDATTVDRSTTYDPSEGQQPTGGSESTTAGGRGVVYENSYRMEPTVRFDAYRVEKLVETVIAEALADVQYDPVGCKELSQTLSGRILDVSKSLELQRYKFIAVVSIGSLRERPGMQLGSRCLWNQSTDSFVSVKFKNGSLYAVVLLYGLYFE